MLDTYRTMTQYNSEQAAQVLFQTDENIRQLLVKIGENNVTITTADIFFGVSGANEATQSVNRIKKAEAELQDQIAAGAVPSEIEEGIDKLCQVISNYIGVIKKDREKISTRLLQVLQIESVPYATNPS